MDREFGLPMDLTKAIMPIEHIIPSLPDICPRDRAERERLARR